MSESKMFSFQTPQNRDEIEKIFNMGKAMIFYTESMVFHNENFSLCVGEPL